MSDFVKDIKQIYLNAEYRILTKLAENVMLDIDSPDWLYLKEAELHMFNAYLENESDLIQKQYEALLPELKETYFNEANKTFSNIKKYKNLRSGINALRNDTVIGLSPITTLTEKANGLLNSASFRMLRSSQDAYRNIIYRVSADTMIGDITRREAAQTALIDFAESGITGFIDKAGRNWELGSYVEMSMRTTIRQAETQAKISALKLEGMNRFVVSSHAENCPLCNPWEGKILTIDNESGYTTVNEAISLGLFHPNCRHTLDVYIEGVTKPVKPIQDKQTNEARYEMTQRQRYNERQIRKYRRMEAVSTGEMKNKYRNKVKEWLNINSQFINDNNLRRDKKREQIETMVR
mgnify:CR=1 FL=1